MYYPELVKSGAANLLVSLLSHENTDIAIDVVEVLQELTDEDVGQEDEEDAEGGEEGGADGKGVGARMAMGVVNDELVSPFQSLRTGDIAYAQANPAEYRPASSSPLESYHLTHS